MGLVNTLDAPGDVRTTRASLVKGGEDLNAHVMPLSKTDRRKVWPYGCRFVGVPEDLCYLYWGILISTHRLEQRCCSWSMHAPFAFVTFKSQGFHWSLQACHEEVLPLWFYGVPNIGCISFLVEYGARAGAILYWVWFWKYLPLHFV